MVSSPPISAVIPNRDGADLLPRTLPPLLAELPPERHEILVVDDGSEDDSVAMLAEQFPTVRVVGLRESVGFGAACNRGFQEAAHDLVLLLNSDMEVTAGSVELLLEHFEDPKVFAAGPEYWADGPDKSRPPSDPRQFWPQLGAPAGGGLFRRQVYLRLGGFDPLYHPFYWEDIDLGWNAWRAGWRIIYDARCHFLHLESATIRRLYDLAYVHRIRTRNRFLFGWKNLRSPILLLMFLARAAVRAGADLVVRSDVNGLVGAFSSVPLIPAALRRRVRGGLSDARILRRSSTPYRALLRV